MMERTKNILLLLVFLCLGAASGAQRVYKSHSVLSSGKWFKISVAGPGVYKMDMGFLKSLGLGDNIPAAQLRLFGRSGAMLPEANSAFYTDDVEEAALQISDGGDGVLNNNDYVLFYAPGPSQWVPDSVSKTFAHKKNLYTDKSFYFISLGGNGKRVETKTVAAAPSVTVTSFDEHCFHELDSVNFLSSGKEWFGEEFASAPGRTTSRAFDLPFTDFITTQPVSVTTNLVSRSIGNGSRFDVRCNNQLVQQINVPAIGGGLYDLFAQQVQQTNSMNLAQPATTFSFTYTPGSFNAQGWLNWFEVFCKRALTMPATGQLSFRDWSSVGNNTAAFSIANAAAGLQVWDVSAPMSPVQMGGTLSNGTFVFNNEAQTLHEYMGFLNSFPVPQIVGAVANQDVHNTTEADYLIITHPQFLAQAQRLAQFHQKREGLKTVVVTTEQVYNEFAAGTPDPTALRDFTKMYFDKYRTTWYNAPKYLLLFGKASFDYKDRLANNTSFVPPYESTTSLEPLGTYTSDDFFGFLDDAENINSSIIINQLDIGIGRIPAKSMEEAKNFVDKLEAYHAPQSFGPWRNNLNFIADDEDNNLHLQDAESLTATVQNEAPVFNTTKIYLDAFRQERGSAGGQYPQAVEAINNNIYNGTLIWNYSGHGGPPRLAEETILDQQMVDGWSNSNKLPLFITASCDFAPYDNPTTNSLGENLLVRPKTGAIALLTTTRIVFAFSNRIINNNYLQAALQKDSMWNYKSLGKALMDAKNFTYQTSGDVNNNRKFALLGDPAMTLAFPSLQVVPTIINGKDITTAPDTLSATETITMQGEVRTKNGSVATDFNGTVYLSLFDKPQNITTLANDPTSFPVVFTAQTSVLFKGKAAAAAGRFSFHFKMPRDINYQLGKGKISLYAQNGTLDGNGFSNNVLIGGVSTNAVSDNEGPTIKAYLNDESFVNGSIANQAPVLIVNLADSSGINTGGASIDHDIVATLDGDNSKYYVLNNFYESELDNYQKGTVHFQLPELPAGHHTLKIKAWDVMNNSSEYLLEFVVVNNSQLQLEHVLNYPNPFTAKTTFWFSHNQPGTDLNVRVEIFTVSGKLIKTLYQAINTTGNRSSDVEWDGRDEAGNKLARGVYIYYLQVSTANGQRKGKWERLVLLN